MLLSALPFLFLWRHLTGRIEDRVYMPPGDFYNQYLPLYAFVRERWLSGEIPLWNADVYGGRPGLADPQASAFYLPQLIGGLLGGADASRPDWLVAQIALSLAIAGVGCYALVKRSTGSAAAATLAGVAFAFSGYLTSFPVEQMAILQSAVWLPATIALLATAYDRLACQHGHGAHAYAALAGLALATSIFGGHPQTAIYVAYTAAAYSLFRICRQIGSDAAATSGGGIRDGARSIVLALAPALVTSVVGLGVGAIQILPTMELIRESTRQSATYAFTSGGFSFVDFANAVFPGATTKQWPLFVGVVPLTIAAAIGTIKSGGRSESGFWIGAAAVSLVLSLGEHSFLYGIFYQVAPGFDSFRNQERASLIWALSVAVLAGIGAAALLRNDVEWCRESVTRFSRGLWWAIAAVAGLAGLMLAARTLSSGQQGEPSGVTSGNLLWALFLLIAVALLVRWRADGGSIAIVASSLVALTALELFTASWQVHVATTNSAESYGETTLMAYLKSQPGPFRVRNDEVWPHNYGVIAGIQDVGGDSPLQIRTVENILASGSEWRIWQILNVRYVVTRSNHDGDPGLELVTSEGDVKLYRMRYPLPRAYLVDRYRVVGDDSAMLAEVLKTDFDPEKEVVLSHAPSMDVRGGSPLDSTPGPVAARVEAWSEGSLHLRVSTPVDALLVLSEVYYPGWTAEIDGRPAGIDRANYAVSCLEVPAGDHSIVFVYRPASVTFGAAISAATVLVLLLAGLLSAYRYLTLSRGTSAHP